MPRPTFPEDTQLPDLLVNPAQDVTIEVIDENGKPAVGAVVKIVTPSGTHGGNYRSVLKTDLNGKYVIQRVASNDTLPIRIYTPTAISDPTLVITPGEHDKPLRIELAPEHGVRLSCRVVDRAGDPIADASVSIATSYPQVTNQLDYSSYWSGFAGGGKTDAEGNFVSGPVWPDLEYSLEVTAEGYAKSESPSRYIKGEKAPDFKTIALAEPNVASISGVFVDANKEPLEGVIVYAAGQTWQLTKTRTNRKGEFKLDQLASDVRYVFAKLKDYRFSGARVSDKPMEIALRRLEESPKGIRPSQEGDREVQLETATGLLKLAWSLPANQRGNARSGILKAMQTIDADEAMKMSIESGGALTPLVHEAEAEQLFESDPDKAIQLLRLIRTRTAITKSIEFAKRLAKTNSDDGKSSAKKFLKFARELVEKDWKKFPQLAAVYTLVGEHEESQKTE